MIIIWRGKGFVIGLVAIACVGLASAITSAIAGEAYAERHTWWGLAGFWAAAALVYALRSWLGVGRQRTLIDQVTGRAMRFTCEGTLFFVPARFWPAILVGLGLWFNFAVRT